MISSIAYHAYIISYIFFIKTIGFTYKTVYDVNCRDILYFLNKSYMQTHIRKERDYANYTQRSKVTKGQARKRISSHQCFKMAKREGTFWPKL